MLAATAVPAYDGVDISGLLEHQLSLSRINRSEAWSAYNQLRITFRADPAARVSAEATLAAISYHGRIQWSPSEIVPDSLRSQVESTPGVTLEDRVFLDRAMVDLFWKRVRFQFGIQPLKWGTGYAWNPTDLFTVKSPTDPTYIEEGINAVKVTVPWRTDGYIAAIFVPEDTWNNSGKGIRWLDYLLGFDASVSYLERTLSPISAEAYVGKERYLGWDITGELWGPGIWAEGAYLFDPNRDDPLKLVVGTDYTTVDGWYFKLEGFHNGDGKSSENDYTADDWLTQLYRSNVFLGENYGLAGVEKTLGDLWRGALYGIGNLSDQSLLINPWLYYDISMSSEIILSAVIPFGGDLAEFRDGNASGFIRFHVYF